MTASPSNRTASPVMLPKFCQFARSDMICPFIPAGVICAAIIETDGKVTNNLGIDLR